MARRKRRNRFHPTPARVAVMTAGYNLHWLLQAMVRLGLSALLLRLGFGARMVRFLWAPPSRNISAFRYVVAPAALGGVG